MIFDSHTHIFPEGWTERRHELAAREPLFAAMYGATGARMATAASLLQAMDRHGVDRAVICGFGWDDPNRCRAHNDQLLDAAHIAGGRLLPFAALSLRDRRAAEVEAERCAGLGFAGFGELRPEWQGLDLADGDSSSWLATLSHGLPLLIHATEPAGHRYSGKEGQGIAALAAFLAARPEVTVIAAHFGGGLPLLAHMPEIAAVCRRLYVDTAAWPLLYAPSVFRATIDQVGAERLLFATDYPLRRHGTDLALLRGAGLTAAEQQAILGENAARLFGLTEA